MGWVGRRGRGGVAGSEGWGWVGRRGRGGWVGGAGVGGWGRGRGPTCDQGWWEGGTGWGEGKSGGNYEEKVRWVEMCGGDPMHIDA